MGQMKRKRGVPWSLVRAGYCEFVHDPVLIVAPRTTHDASPVRFSFVPKELTIGEEDIEKGQEGMRMFELESGAAGTFGRMHRRDWLRVGFLGLGGLTLADLLRMRAQGAADTTDTAVILLFVHGGPSHLE